MLLSAHIALSIVARDSSNICDSLNTLHGNRCRVAEPGSRLPTGANKHVSYARKTQFASRSDVEHCCAHRILQGVITTMRCTAKTLKQSCNDTDVYGMVQSKRLGKCCLHIDRQDCDSCQEDKHIGWRDCAQYVEVLIIGQNTYHHLNDCSCR